MSDRFPLIYIALCLAGAGLAPWLVTTGISREPEEPGARLGLRAETREEDLRSLAEVMEKVVKEPVRPEREPAETGVAQAPLHSQLLRQAEQDPEKALRLAHEKLHALSPAEVIQRNRLLWASASVGADQREVQELAFEELKATAPVDYLALGKFPEYRIHVLSAASILLEKAETEQDQLNMMESILATHKGQEIQSALVVFFKNRYPGASSRLTQVASTASKQ